MSEGAKITTEAKDRWLSRSIVWVAITILALPVVYVLSLGPVTWWMARYAKTSPGIASAFESIYRPLSDTCHSSEWVCEVLTWYQYLWIP